MKRRDFLKLLAATPAAMTMPLGMSAVAELYTAQPMTSSSASFTGKEFGDFLRGNLENFDPFATELVPVGQVGNVVTFRRKDRRS